MSQPGLPFSVGASLRVGFGGASASINFGNAPSQGQSFQTLSLPNLKLALYTLSIRNPDPPNLPLLSYTFPLSPESIHKETLAMNNTWDVAGSADLQGVERVADIYGTSPPVFLIEGTTGWKFHSMDGFSMTGNESIAALQDALAQYASLNRDQMDNDLENLYLLEFYDYFTGEFWQVVPVGPQIIRQNNRRPLVFDYSLRLAAIKAVDAPLPIEINDPILNIFALTQPQAVTTLSASLSLTLSDYASNTAGSVSVAAGITV